MLEVLKNKDLHIAAKGLFAYIYSMLDNGVAYISQEDMCTDLNISRDTLCKYMKELIDKDIILKTQLKINGKYSVCGYSMK